MRHVGTQCLTKSPKRALTEVDRPLRKVLSELAGADDEYWACRDKRAFSTALYQYPALMVPEVQRRVISALVSLQNGVRTLVDPFLGAGTVALEGMLQGLDVVGQDVNPLAILVSKVRSGPYPVDNFRRASAEVLERTALDRVSEPDVQFPGRDKWYLPKNCLELAKLRRAIRFSGSLDGKRFLWVALAETARLTSNSRTSTYKLHIRPQTEIESLRNRSPIELFGTVVERNLSQLRTIREALEQKGRLSRGEYLGTVSIQLGDTRDGVPASRDNNQQYDLLVTSPPYGDNLSTVPYGQNSYLPLQWLELDDIEPGIDRKLIQTTQEMDRRSLGGRWGSTSVDLKAAYIEKSPTLRATLKQLEGLPPDRFRRVAVFFGDLDQTLELLSASLKPNAYMVWTVGNRRVGEREVPTDRILCELLSHYGVRRVLSLKRPIVSKRMATKNAMVSTMRSESILVLRKVASGKR